jgi:hypothetical protein
MLLCFSVPFASLTYIIGDGEPCWVARWGRARVVPEFTIESYPPRGDVSIPDEYPVEFFIRRKVDGSLNKIMYTRGLDERVEDWRGRGIPCDEDAYRLLYTIHPQKSLPSFSDCKLPSGNRSLCRCRHLWSDILGVSTYR